MSVLDRVRLKPGQVPPPIDWSAFQDGRLRRFKRGLHYVGPAGPVQKQARAAAKALSRNAATSVEATSKAEYLWVQFNDGQARDDEPCQRCGHRELDWTQKYFLRCPRCRALYELHDEDDEETANQRQVAQLVATELRAPDRSATEEMELTTDDEIVASATWSFSRPVVEAHASMHFFSLRDESRRKALRMHSPDVMPVTAPGLVRFDLSVEARLLEPGRYKVIAGMEYVVGSGDETVVKIEAGLDHRLLLTVVDARGAGDRTGPPATAAGSGLQWSSTRLDEDSVAYESGRGRERPPLDEPLDALD